MPSELRSQNWHNTRSETAGVCVVPGLAFRGWGAPEGCQLWAQLLCELPPREKLQPQKPTRATRCIWCALWKVSAPGWPRTAVAGQEAGRPGPYPPLAHLSGPVCKAAAHTVCLSTSGVGTLGLTSFVGTSEETEAKRAQETSDDQSHVWSQCLEASRDIRFCWVSSESLSLCQAPAACWVRAEAGRVWPRLTGMTESR